MLLCANTLPVGGEFRLVAIAAGGEQHHAAGCLRVAQGGERRGELAQSPARPGVVLGERAPYPERLIKELAAQRGGVAR
jgi:hypothetical protein